MPVSCVQNPKGRAMAAAPRKPWYVPVPRPHKSHRRKRLTSLMLGSCDLCQAPAATLHGRARCVRCQRAFGPPRDDDEELAQAAGGLVKDLPALEEKIRARAGWGHSIRAVALACGVPEHVVERILKRKKPK